MYGCRDPVCRLPFGNDINLHSRLDLKEMCSSLGGGRRKREGGGQENEKKSERPVDALAVKKSDSLTDNFKSRDAMLAHLKRLGIKKKLFSPN